MIGTLCLALLCLSACRSMRGGGDWYRGPGELRDQVQGAVNTALAELPRDIGGPLKWDWKRNTVKIVYVAQTGSWNGIPTVRTPEGVEVFGYAQVSTIYLPRGFGLSTLRHEAGHVVLVANGKHNTPAFDHHRLAYFIRHSAVKY
jgi:hypothetical protein